MITKNPKNVARGKAGGKPKLNPEHIVIVIKMLGAWCTGREIVEYLGDQNGISISQQAIGKYRKTHAKEIEDCRKDFLKLVEVVPLIDKTARIVMRQKLIYNLVGSIYNDVDVVPKKLWIEEFSAKTGVKIKEHGNHAVVNALLDSIQTEVEPRRMALTDPDGKGDQMEKVLNILAERDRRAEEMVNLSLSLLRKNKFGSGT